MSTISFEGKQVVVIGGSSGIGNATAQAFRNAGAKVLVTGTRDTAEAYGDQEPGRFKGLAYSRLNLDDPDAVAQWEPGLDSLDVLVLSQGTVEYGRREFEAATFRRIVDINLNSILACAEKLRPLLAKCGGSVITISSVGGLRVPIGNPAYAASKAGLIHLTRVLVRRGLRKASASTALLLAWSVPS